jgi:hypothetical protein
MKTRTTKLLQFALLFSILAGFTLVSIGAVQSEDDFVQAVSAAQERNPANGVYVGLSDDAFESKLLDFLKQEKVCALTTEQAEKLSSMYDVETRLVDVDGTQVSVLYIEGTPLSKRILELDLESTIDSESCQVVHGNKVVAVLSPAFVS